MYIKAYVAAKHAHLINEFQIILQLAVVFHLNTVVLEFSWLQEHFLASGQLMKTFYKEY
jgi:hypothetical protein